MPAARRLPPYTVVRMAKRLSSVDGTSLDTVSTMPGDTSTTGTGPSRRRFLAVVGGGGIQTVLGVGSSGPFRSSERQYEIRPFSVTSFDGTVLRGHLHLPVDADRPLAPVLNLSPYWNTANRNPSDHPSGRGCEADVTSTGSHVCTPHWLSPLVEQGFAHAAVNLRGTGLSDGCMDHGGPRDVRDAQAVVEGLAARDWSNGRVGMYGSSFDGWAQSLAITSGVPSLEAVVPVSSVIDLWSVFTFTGAAHGVGGIYAPAWDGTTSMVTVPPRSDHIECPGRIEDWEASTELAVTGTRTPWWQVRDYREALADSRVPMFVANGLGAGEGHILQIEGLYESREPKTTRMLLGQWGHGKPARADWMDMVVDWFDHYLRDGPAVLPAGVVEYQDDTGVWHTTDTWPPAADRTALFLSAGGLVPDRQSVAASHRRFQSEVTSPGLDPSACGPQQVLYASPPLAEEVLLAGTVTVDTTLTSTLPGGNFAAYLFHTPGDGSCPDRAAETVAYALADLRHWKTPGRGRPFPVADPTPVSFESIPFAAPVPAGHRLVLAIGGGSEVLYPDPLQPALTVSTGADRPGALHLPVVAGDLQFEAAGGGSVSPVHTGDRSSSASREDSTVP